MWPYGPLPCNVLSLRLSLLKISHRCGRMAGHTQPGPYGHDARIVLPLQPADLWLIGQREISFLENTPHMC